ncbi:multimeric flavodoxin WrbA [Halobacteroides halobius DSM 5150]|uniref:Multimeric flavodoxin WrbA n=1 Tax=Halobacteroides halobius (strain ATCC 35273 / DSM 5150 / MD-1) TaxID=748449 RepID=L0KCW4_HALHC|nr:flavodoxin family protein [Halobacteroides halobius]AGB41918.1 multimeric flavodoxin WrbA [Halobacteroides halobius DSM 5150]
MKGLSVLGSPRHNGNNALLLQEINSSLKENCNIKLDKIEIDNLDISPCLSCDYCKKNINCTIADDMIKLYSKFDEADIILISSPLYFNTVSAQLKAMIDRCQALWANRFVLKKPLIDPNKKRLGAFVSTAGQPITNDRFKYVTSTLDLFFKAISADYYDNFFVGNIDHKPITNRPKIISDAYDWGERLAQELKRL